MLHPAVMVNARLMRIAARTARAIPPAAPHPASIGTLRRSEVDRQVVLGIVEIERHTTSANLLCLALVALSALALPFRDAFVLPLLLRLGIMINTKQAFAAMRQTLAEGGDYRRQFPRLIRALGLGGVAWGATLAPLLLHPEPHSARLLVAGGTIVGIAFIAALVSPSVKLLLAFIGGIILTLAATVVWSNHYESDVLALASLAGLSAIFIAYSRATAVGQRRSAQLFVENAKIGEILADALERTRFLAEHDQLTGLSNRRALFDYANRLEHDRLRQVIILDLDHFKDINDRHGHGVGDKVLAHAGQVLTAAMLALGAGRARAARIGGEEFAMIVDCEDMAVAWLCAERIRLELALLPDSLSGTGIAATASFGIAPWLPDDDLGTALNHADAALYHAKQSGRNRIKVAGDDGPGAIVPVASFRTGPR